MSKFTIGIVGNRNVGKSSIMRRIVGEYSNKYIPTEQAQSCIVPFHTSEGIFECNIIDYPGNYYPGNLLDSQADMFIIIIDSIEFPSVKVCEFIQCHSPHCVIGMNKCEIKSENTTEIVRKFNPIKCSSKNNYMMEQLFLTALQKLTGNCALIIEEPCSILHPVLI